MDAPKLQPTYDDGVGLRRCAWCLHPALSSADAETLRTNLSAIIAAAVATKQPAIESLARLALAQLQEPHD